ncbi:hypothetical protein SO694_00028054 [Aureococcus anophagefferens]|uniref:Prolyl 4-hydroxylase alpha subunit Fe(2+) 2OG dioxygenase domain-containing protein n=1 Tax=Aureococcus anophagefferens TaxID=44056 RepID=A0ABR1FVG3_AURAN
MVPSIVPPSPPPATELLSVGAAQKTRVRRIAGFLGGGELDAALASLLALRSTLHEVAAGGALPDPDHYDSGSYATIDVMLSAPGVDFEGGHFETLRGRRVLRPAVFDRGDALVFCSHKKHCVRPVTKGTRRVLGRRGASRARTPLALAGCLRLGRDDAAADGDEYKRAVAELERRVAAAAPAEAARAPRKKKKKAKALPAAWHGHAMPMLWFALDAVDAHDAPATVRGANGALVRAARNLDSEPRRAAQGRARAVARFGWAWDGAAAIARRARVTAPVAGWTSARLLDIAAPRRPRDVDPGGVGPPRRRRATCVDPAPARSGPLGDGGVDALLAVGALADSFVAELRALADATLGPAGGAARRLMLDIVRALAVAERAAGRDAAAARRATRVVDFTFVAEPFSRLLSGYHEIDGARCPSSARGPGWHCGRAYKLEAPGSRARFEAFVREVLPEDFDPARLDDAISYHVASQASAVSPYRRFDFVGRLETLRASVLSLLSLAVDDPERYASRLAGLLVQKHARPRGANGTAPQASRADAGCLSNETRRLILARLGQDYRCFGYDAAYLEGGVRASRCSEVRW